MPHSITPGIEESELEDWLNKALKKYGKYNNEGVNFTHADIAPIVMCTIVSGEDILLVKRGQGLADASGYWSTVNGFIDEVRPVREIAQKELREELSVKVELESIKVAKSYTLANPKEKRKYIVFPCLVRLNHKPKIVLDYENTDYKWIKREDLESFHVLDDLPYSIDAALKA